MISSMLPIVDNIPVKYVTEPVPPMDRPRRFLEVFAAVLKHSSYSYLLDHFARVAAKCGMCAVECPVYQATGRTQVVPCARSASRRLPPPLRPRGARPACRGTAARSADIDKMAEASIAAPPAAAATWMSDGADHGLLTHLGRYILSEMDIAPGARRLRPRAARREERKHSGIPVAAPHTLPPRTTRRSSTGTSSSRSTWRGPSTSSFPR
jgi:hypothetical protein